MGADASKMNALTIEDNTKDGGKWCIFKSARAGLLTVRNYGTESSVLNLWAPPDAVGSSVDGKNREATLSLVRANNDESESEFIDIYNQDYASCGREAGIRIQKRGETTCFPAFKIEFSDGTNLHEAMRFTPPTTNDDQPRIEMKSPVSLLNNKLSGLALPENDDDAANKIYVDQNINKCSIYRLDHKDYSLAPILQHAFFVVQNSEQDFWQGILKSGFYKFHLNFVGSCNGISENKIYITLDLDDTRVLCQKIRSGDCESNYVHCSLEVRKDSIFSIKFLTHSVGECVELKTLHAGKTFQSDTFLLELTQILKY